jgi:hypothetical protein
MAKKTKPQKVRGQVLIVDESSQDPLRVQIAAEVKRPKGVKITAKVIREAILAKLNDEDLKDPRGFKLRIVWWQNPTRNPKRKNPRDGKPLNARRDYGPDSERWETLRGPLLQSNMDVQPLGKGKRS